MKENERELSEEEVTRKRFERDDWTLQKEMADLSIEQYQKMLDLDLPNKKIRAEMHRAESMRDNAASNIKVLEKQIREKKVVSFVPEVEDGTE